MSTGVVETVAPGAAPVGVPPATSVAAGDASAAVLVLSGSAFVVGTCGLVAAWLSDPVAADRSVAGGCGAVRVIVIVRPATEGNAPVRDFTRKTQPKAPATRRTAATPIQPELLERRRVGLTALIRVELRGRG